MRKKHINIVIDNEDILTGLEKISGHTTLTGKELYERLFAVGVITEGMSYNAHEFIRMLLSFNHEVIYEQISRPGAPEFMAKSLASISEDQWIGMLVKLGEEAKEAIDNQKEMIKMVEDLVEGKEE